MFKKYFVGFSAVLLLAILAMSSNVQARFFDAFGGPKKPVVEKPALKLISCEDGAVSLKAQGFSHVFATDCSGGQYRYNGFQKSNEVTIIFNAQSGGVTTVSR